MCLHNHSLAMLINIYAYWTIFQITFVVNFGLIKSKTCKLKINNIAILPHRGCLSDIFKISFAYFPDLLNHFSGGEGRQESRNSKRGMTALSFALVLT